MRTRKSLFEETPIRILNQEHFEKVKRTYIYRQKLSICCQSCKNIFEVQLQYSTGLICKSCKRKQTKKERYGDSNYNNRPKAKSTSKAKFGVESYMQTKEAKENLSTWFKNNPDKVSDRTKKRFETCAKNFGDLENYKRSMLETLTGTLREKYGVENISQLDAIKKKKAESLVEHFGSLENAYKMIREKSEETFMKRYGVKNISQLEGFYKNMKRKLKFQNHSFDSKLELSFFKYLTEQLNLKPEEDFEMQKKYPKPFFVEGTEHFTFVDFYIKSIDTWVECKGACFFDENGNPQLPFGKNKDPINQQKGEKIWKEKYTFLKKEGIKLVTSSEDFPILLVL